MRICSLLPSATEIVFALGAGELLAGASHECDYPAAASRIPKITRSRIPAGLSSQQIDSAVSSNLESANTLYDLDLDLLEKLQPDLIITQRLCNVCAVSFDTVQEAAERLPSRPQVLNLEANSLAGILESVRTVGKAIGRESSAAAVTDGLQRRIEAVRGRTMHLAQRPRVFCMEWVDPPFCGGHWMKELVDIAGGNDALANHQRPSCRIEWKRVLEFSPEVIVLTCCGFDLRRCAQEAEILAGFDGFSALPAAKAGHVFATDGSAYFSRPGPRIVDSLEILAHLVHPELFDAPDLGDAFCRLSLPPVRASRLPEEDSISARSSSGTTR